MLAAIFPHLLRCQAFVLAHDIGRHRLTGMFIGYADDGGLDDLRVPGQHVLHLVGIDVEARDEHHVLDPVHDPDLAVFLKDGDVAGAEEPVIGHGLGGFFRLVPVARHDLGPAHTKLALFLVTEDLAVLVAHSDVRRWDRETDRAGELFQIHGIGADDGRGLGQPVALDDGAVGEFLPLARHRLLRRHSARDREVQPGKVHVLDLRMVGERIIKGVHQNSAGEGRALQGLHEAVDIARIGDQQLLGAEMNKQAAGRQCENVIQRQRRNHHVFLVGGDGAAHPGIELRDIGRDVEMLQRRPLRQPGRAAGILQEGDILPVDLDRLEGACARGGDDLGETDRLQGMSRDRLLHVARNQIDDDALQAEKIAWLDEHDPVELHVRQGFFHRRGEILQDEDEPRAGIVELMAQFTAGVERVDIDHGQPGSEDAEEDRRISHDVGHHDRDAITLG